MTPDDNASVVRHDEQLHLDIEKVPVETVRIEKYIVTERQTFTADVRREELRITRTPIADGDRRPSPVDGSSVPPIIIVLHQERLTVTTTTVPVERVTVRVTTVTGEHRVEDVLQHETIDIAEHD